MNKKTKRLLSALVACATGFYFSAYMNVPQAFAGENTTLRVGTWNIDSKAHPDIKKMTDLLAKKQIDIVGCQEIDIFNERNNYDMVSAFINKTYPYTHFAKGRDFANGYFGIGVVSKHKLLEESSIPIESTGSRATKTLERVVFEKDGKKIALYNTHLSWENLDLRRRQIKEVIDRINADPIEYKVITGDFNADQHPYEYSMFLDNFNIANGNNNQWFDTYGENDDPSMKVFTIDNIIATKNIKIKTVEMVKEKLADHYMLVADLELLSESEGNANSNNLALGQAVTVSSKTKNSSPYLLVDYDKNTAWLSDNSAQQEITIELDRLYDVDYAKINWGDVQAIKYQAATSVNGIDYTPYQNMSLTDTIKIGTAAKFLKINLPEKSASTPYQINEIEIFGKRAVQPISTKNILNNGDMETITNKRPAGWQFVVTPETAPSFKYNLTSDTTEKYSGKSSAKLTLTSSPTGKEKGDGMITQTIPLKPNKRYQLSFWHKTDTLTSASFAYEINQVNSAGEKIPTHLARLTDNLNMSKAWRQFQYNFITAPSAAQANIALHVVKGNGSLWIDDIDVKEVIPTENILLSTKKTTLSIGETTKITAKIQPANATDIKLHWVSSDEKVITVDTNGNAKAIAKGQASIGLRSDSDLIAESTILLTVE